MFLGLVFNSQANINSELHVFYYSSVKFVETPLSPIEGSIALSKAEAMTRNHYRFAYNQLHQLVSVSFFNGDVPRNPNHTANLFTLSHRMEFNYASNTETITFFNTDGNAIEVLGNCAEFIYRLNDLGYRHRLYFMDKHKKRVTNSWGIYEYRWDLQGDGSVIENRVDETGKQVSIRPSFEFYQLRLRFNPWGHIALMQNIDSDGNLLENSSGASQDRITTNAHGNFLEWNVLDNQDNLECGNGPNVAIGKQRFDAYGYEIGLEHQDETGKTIASHYGIFRSQTEFDKYGNIVKRNFYDADNHPTNHSNAGYHQLQIKWDKSGNQRESLTYFDSNGKAYSHALRGYHAARYLYDQNGRLIKISYHSETGVLVNRKDNGRAYTIFTYNKADGTRTSQHFDKNDKQL